jgi:peptidoglycan/xylan/chitin deacetylase (PgdA/CDA1 family)
MSVSRRAFLLGALATAAAACSTDEPTAVTGPSSSTGTAAGTTSGGSAPASTTTGAVSSSTASTAGGPSATTTTTPTTTAKGSPTTKATAPPVTAKPPAAFVDRGPSGSDKVALTFHTNGDLGLAQQLLDIFTDKHAVMTNFIVGNWLAANSSWARKLQDAGHELANHTQTHPNFASLSEDAMLREISLCRDLLWEFGNDIGRYFRPSGTDDGTARPSDKILAVAGKAGYATVLGWNVEPFDYQDPGEDAVRSRVLDQISGGAIVSLHFGHPGTIAALPAILDGISSRGLHTVTVSDLLR